MAVPEDTTLSDPAEPPSEFRQQRGELGCVPLSLLSPQTPLDVLISAIIIVRELPSPASVLPVVRYDHHDHADRGHLCHSTDAAASLGRDDNSSPKDPANYSLFERA